MKYLFFAFVLLSFFGCNTVDDEVELSPDGNDLEGFEETSAAGINFSYRISGDSLHCYLIANTEGWIAVGFNPSVQMKDANFIIGYVEDDVVYIRDDWGTSSSQHQSDVSLGGADNVTVLGGSETGGITTIQFRIPLDSGDAYDRVLIAGNSYTIILAKGSGDSFGSYHSTRGSTQINLQQ